MKRYAPHAPGRERHWPYKNIPRARKSKGALQGVTQAGCRGLRAQLGDWLARLEISQQRKAGSSSEEVLERMPAQDEIRVDRMVIEFKQLGERIERAGNNPVERAGIFGWGHQKQQ